MFHATIHHTPTRRAHLDDLIVWPDGTYCEREQLFRGEFSYMSDDYTVLAQGTSEWLDFAIEHALIQPSKD